MTELIEVDPHQLRKAADVTQNLADKVHEVIEQLRNTLSGLESDGGNRPWGNDSTGKKFADGEKGYKAVRKNMFDGITGMAGTLSNFAAGQRDAADVMHGQDEAASRSFVPARA